MFLLKTAIFGSQNDAMRAVRANQTVTMQLENRNSELKDAVRFVRFGVDLETFFLFENGTIRIFLFK